jgi:hypothetical protein
MRRGRNRREPAQGATAARSEGVSNSLWRRTLVSRRGHRGREEDAKVGEEDIKVRKGAAVVGKEDAEVEEGDVDVGKGAAVVGKEPPWWGRRTPRLGEEMLMWGKEPPW